LYTKQLSTTDKIDAAKDLTPTVLYTARSIKALGYGVRLLASAMFGEDDVDTSLFTFKNKGCA
jgi:hypothetical protein